MLLSAFDGIVYINLDHRTDRNEAFLKEMERLRVDPSCFHRIPACSDPLNGVRGCLESHIKALSVVKEKGWRRGLILEDDCLFSEAIDGAGIEEFFLNALEDWDVFLLGGIFSQKEEADWQPIVRIKRSLLAHAYCVNTHYISTLLKCFEEGLEFIKDHLFFYESHRFAADRVWHKLQKKDRWFAPKEAVAFQRFSFSDIDHCEKSKNRR